MPGGQQRQTSESTQTQVLPANQQANVDLLMQGIGQLQQSGGPQYYPGQNYTTATPEQQQARQMASGYATGAGQTFANTAVQSNQSMMDPIGSSTCKRRLAMARSGRGSRIPSLGI